MSKAKTEPLKKRRSLWWLFLLLSLLLHLPLLYLLEQGLRIEPLQVADRAEPLRLQFTRPQQIVETQQLEERPVEQTDLVAPKASATRKEMVAAEVGPVRNEQSQPEQKEKAKTKGQNKRLVPEMRDLIESRASQQSNYLKREEGPVTLLNAKSSPYADYFLQAGHRVVRYLNLNADLMSWYLQDFKQLRFPAALELQLTADGRVAGVRLRESSGSSKIDTWFLQAVRSGFADQTPPPELSGANGSFIILAQLHVDHIALGIP